MRTVFTTAAGAWKNLEGEFRTIAERFAMEWQAHDSAVRQRVVILVSKADHCLSDLLYRYRTKQLRMTVPAIISNHPDLAPLAEWHEIPFHHLPVTPQTKPEQEQRLSRLIEEYDADLVVLARYMQILSPALCEKLEGRAINIHHSFLPSFKGAKPYHQAHERGVKLIGATAHYVTPDLDEGPIIEQAAERVDHTYTPQDLIAVGRDIENLVLARALRYHLEHPRPAQRHPNSGLPLDRSPSRAIRTLLRAKYHRFEMGLLIVTVYKYPLVKRACNGAATA